MYDKTGAQTEALPTVRAFVGSLACVDSLMVNEVRTLSEASVTVGTPVRLHPGVNPLMLNQVGALREASAAIEAHVGFLPSVGPPVFNKGRLVIETFLAVGALEWFQARVDPLVSDEVRAPAEPLFADGALVAPFRLVGPVVLRQSGKRATAFPALGADVVGLLEVIFQSGHSPGGLLEKVPWLKKHLLLRKSEVLLKSLCQLLTVPGFCFPGVPS